MISGMKSAPYLLSSLLLLWSLSPAHAQSRPWTTQIASFSMQDEADGKVSELKAQGVAAYWIKSKVPGAGVRYRVRIGRFASRSAAQAQGEQLRKRGLAPDYFAAEYEAPPKAAAAQATPPVKAETRPAEIAAAVRPRIATTSAPVTVSKPVTVTPPVKKPASALPAPAKTPALVATKTPTPAPVKTPAPVATKTPPPAPTKAPVRSPEVVGNPKNSKGLVKPVNPVPPGFLTFEDSAVGYSFDYPNYWIGTAWTDAEKVSQNVDGGASFKSKDDAAFLNVIWNKLSGANDPQKYDNTLLVDTIIKSMGAGSDTQTLNERSRRVENEAGQIKIYIDLNALFRDPSSSTTLNFLGKALITRCQQGILLVVVFYSQDAPPVAATNADRIIRSVRPPG